MMFPSVIAQLNNYNSVYHIYSYFSAVNLIAVKIVK